MNDEELAPMRLRSDASAADPALRRALDTAARTLPDSDRAAALSRAIIARAESMRAPRGRLKRVAARLAVAAGLGIGIAVWVWMHAGADNARTHEPARAAAEGGSVAASPGAEPDELSEARDSAPALAPSTDSEDPHAPAPARSVVEHATGDVADARIKPRGPVSSSAPVRRARPREPQVQTPVLVPGGTAEAPTQTTVPPELQLLSEAQAALRKAPARALELARWHERAYPHGQFVQERETIAIEALLALGDNAAGSARGRAFLARFPDSAHASRIAQRIGASRARP